MAKFKNKYKVESTRMRGWDYAALRGAGTQTGYRQDVTKHQAGGYIV